MSRYLDIYRKYCGARLIKYYSEIREYIQGRAADELIMDHLKYCKSAILTKCKKTTLHVIAEFPSDVNAPCVFMISEFPRGTKRHRAH